MEQQPGGARDQALCLLSEGDGRVASRSWPHRLPDTAEHLPNVPHEGYQLPPVPAISPNRHRCVREDEADRLTTRIRDLPPGIHAHTARRPREVESARRTSQRRSLTGLW